MSSVLPATIYINGSMTKEHVGKAVRLVGEVMHVNGNIATIRASDGIDTKVVRQSNAPAYPSKFVCITGIVQQDSSLNESISESFGDYFNLENFNKVIGVTNGNGASGASSLFHTLQK